MRKLWNWLTGHKPNPEHWTRIENRYQCHWCGVYSVRGFAHVQSAKIDARDFPYGVCPHCGFTLIHNLTLTNHAATDELVAFYGSLEKAVRKGWSRLLTGCQ